MEIDQFALLARKEQGITQDELALRAGVYQAGICRFENGQGGVRTFARIAQILGALGFRLVVLDAGGAVVWQPDGEKVSD